MGKISRSDFIRYLSIRYPVSGLLVFRGDVAIVRRLGGSNGADLARGDRRPIVILSKKSRMRLAFIAMASPVRFQSIITLTYGSEFPIDGKTVKHQLRLFLNRLKADYGASYLWVIEFQRRGAPHFHIAVDYADPTAVDRAWLAETWVESCGYGRLPYRQSGLDQPEYEQAVKMYRVHAHEKAWEPIREPDGANHYFVKYATKTYQKQVPSEYIDVGRFWGCSQDVTAGIAPEREITADEGTIRDTLEAIGNGAYNLDILPKVVFGVQRE